MFCSKNDLCLTVDNEMHMMSLCMPALLLRSQKQLVVFVVHVIVFSLFAAERLINCSVRCARQHLAAEKDIKSARQNEIT